MRLGIPNCVRGVPFFPLATVFAFLLSAGAAGAAPNPHNTLDCLFCHDSTPRFGVDTGETIGFYRYDGDDPRLCYVCHKPEENLHPVLVRPGEGALGTVAPSALPLASSQEREGTVVCTTCHFIHAADSERALLRGFAGSQTPDTFYQWQQLCRHCHGEGLDRRSPHSGDEQACAFCHAARPEKGGEAAVLPRGIALCNFCHGALQDDHTQGLNPFEAQVDCLSCHDPHLGPDRPARLKPAYFDFLRGAVTVNPHGRRTLCGLCHVEEENFTLLTTDRDALCNRCHGSPNVIGEMHPLAELAPGTAVPQGWPLHKGRLTCLTCHLPGHPTDRSLPKLLRGGPYESRNRFCEPCHDDPEERNRDPHILVAKLQGCEDCHDRRPIFGRDTAKTVTFKASVNMLCLQCHDDTPHPGSVFHTVALTTEEADQIPYYYPVDRYRRINCATCHNPHLGESEGLKLRETISGMEICTDCHGF